MGELEITAVDPFDATSFDPWHATYAEATRHGRDPDVATVWTLEEMRVQMQDPHERRMRSAWSGCLDGRVVVVGYLEGSNLDNLANAELFVATVPDERRHGYGEEMLAHVEGVALERGRTTVAAEVAWPHEADPNGAGVPDVQFATSRGYEVGLVDVQRQLPLPVDDALLDRLAAQAAPHHEGYTLRTFPDRIPDDLVQGWAELTASLMTEAPTGEMDREPEIADVSVVRAREEMVAKQGRRKFNTVALSPGGEVVAYTDIAITVHESDRAYQWGTLVRRDHRGHRLGLAVKVANLRLLQVEALQVKRVVTYNAEVNDHMIGVNQALGFVPVERMGELQKRLGRPTLTRYFWSPGSR